MTETDVYDWGYRDGKAQHNPSYTGLVRCMSAYVAGYRAGQAELSEEETIGYVIDCGANLDVNCRPIKREER